MEGMGDGGIEGVALHSDARKKTRMRGGMSGRAAKRGRDKVNTWRDRKRRIDPDPTQCACPAQRFRKRFPSLMWYTLTGPNR